MCVSTSKKQKERGFTLIEILIVLGILGGIMAVVLTNVVGGGDSARIKETSVRVSGIQQLLVRYQVDVGRYPETKDGLNALITNPGVSKWAGPYAQDEKDMLDAWNQPFEYELTTKGPKLTSRGKDGEPGTEDDLVFINGKAVEKAGEAEAPKQ